MGEDMRELKHILFFFLLSLIVGGCEKKKEITVIPVDHYTGKKIFYFDSYHEEYECNRITRAAFEKAISNRGIEVRYAFLNAKNIRDTALLKERALRYRDSVEIWKPDLIIASDDAVNKYLISPCYRNSSVPVIFIGVNWTASSYGYPADNITGQIETGLVNKLLSDLKSHSSGDRIGVLTGNTLTDRKSLAYYKDSLNISFEKELFVDSFSQWKSGFLTMQESVDILLLRSVSGIENWDGREAHEFVEAHTGIPTGTVNGKLEEYVVLAYPKDNGEFGEYAGKTALRILSGTAPGDIPVSENRRASMNINAALAERAGIKFSADMMAVSHIWGNAKKILFVNSYHQGYEWSDGIERGLLSGLGISAKAPFDTLFSSDSLELRIIRMDSKRNQTPSFMAEKTGEVINLIESWKPDIVIASDDNAVKNVVADHYRESTIPFIYCGVNWDASEYGFPTENVTGIVEVAPVKELIEFLTPFTAGSGIGLIGADVVSERKELEHYRDVLGIAVEKWYLVDSFEEWKKGYLTLQDSVDLLILVNPVGIHGWDESEAEAFVLENSRIPSGTTSKMLRKFALVSFTRLAEEQGIWSGKRALEILGGKRIEEIAPARNICSSKYLNMKLAKRLNIRFPSAVMDSAILVGEDVQ